MQQTMPRFANHLIVSINIQDRTLELIEFCLAHIVAAYNVNSNPNYIKSLKNLYSLNPLCL